MSPLDLNLLGVFDTLYEQRSVTRAAARLGLTQSAVSHALRRLRDALDDPLFVRAGKRLQPTARAEAMAGDIRAGLERLRGAVVPGSFDPAIAQRTFTVAAGSYLCHLMVPELLGAIRQDAPGVTIRIVPFEETLLAALDDKSVDLAFGVFERIPARLAAQRLFREELVWIAAAGSDLVGRALAAGDLVDRPRLALGPPRPFGMPDAVVHAGGLAALSVTDTIARRTSDEPHGRAVVYDALTAIKVVGATDLIAIVPRRVAELDGARLGAAILDVRAPPVTLDLFMLWHRQMEADPGLAWLRGRIADH